MKTKSYYLGLVLLGFLTWSCSNKDEAGLTSASQGSLKIAMNTGAQNLTTAMSAITNSKGYQVLESSGPTLGPSLVKSASSSTSFVSAPQDTIPLSAIAGIYDYKAAKYKKWRPELFNFFAKTGTSTDFIVRLPESKVKNPGSLFRFTPTDTTLVNNYVIDVSKYNYNFGRFLWNYDLTSTITIDNTEAGVLNIQSSNNRTDGYHFMSDFAFANGYDAKIVYSTGDTILSDYNISKAGAIIFEEKFTSIKADAASRHREKEYSLTIGNVTVVRSPTHANNGLDSAKVYVGGVLQAKATVKFIDITSKSDTTEFSIVGHNRDLQITFDDGTTQTVSQLLGSTITDVRTLFTSLRQVYFATSVVDWVAWDIYMNKKNM
ncbi:MAG: hypothetical protein Q8904_03405 [Bacteroidota bacterium]|nr:hypothetical protein [Bacteroidota bacterium]